jgi:hypothetical protein
MHWFIHDVISLVHFKFKRLKDKQYYEANKDIILIKRKEYVEKNKDIIN